MAQNERELTFQAYNIPAKRDSLEAEYRRRCRAVAGRETPLLPAGWTDEDAWQLARTLAKRMAHAKWYAALLYTATQDAFPAEDTPLEELPPQDCSAAGQVGEPGTPAPFPLDLCTELLHCGILAAISAPRALLPTNGTFGALEDLFTGLVMTGSGPMLRFEAMLQLLPLSLSWEDLHEKCRKADARNAVGEWDYQRENKELLHIWHWLDQFPCRDALLQAVGRIKSEECYQQAIAFVRSNMAAMAHIAALSHGAGLDGWGYNGFLREAIDLYLYQTGAHNLLDWQADTRKDGAEDNCSDAKGDV